MTEEDAKLWLGDFGVSRETLESLGGFGDLLMHRSSEQNLIAESTKAEIWARHIVDSAQVLPLASEGGEWLDLGSGAGFPGLIVAAIGARPVTLVESRSKRVAFLHDGAAALGIAAQVEVIAQRLEVVPSRPVSTISARAFAPLPRLLALAHRFATPETIWLLPKGRSAAAELAEVAGSWQGDFRMVPSVTDPEAAIIVAQDVRPRKRR